MVTPNFEDLTTDELIAYHDNYQHICSLYICQERQMPRDLATKILDNLDKIISILEKRGVPVIKREVQ